MKKILLFFLLANLQANAQKQEFSLNSLLNFTKIPETKFQSYVSRKGYEYVPPEDTLNATTVFYKKEKKKPVEKLLERYDRSDTSVIIFQTTSYDEFMELNNELQEKEFVFAKENLIRNNIYSLYQKGSIIIKPQIKTEDNKTLYSFIVERKDLPRQNDIEHVEDLLQLTTHEYIAAVFGDENVKKDIFYFSEKELNKCSILFPNTTMQVIFVWKDQVNNRDPLFLVVGRSSPGTPGNKTSYYKAIEHSKWKSLNGIYPGMSLKDLYELNGQDIQFYGWETEGAGFVVRDNPGLLNFKKLGVQLNCLDCNEDKYYSDSNIINSSSILKENRRVFVSTLMIKNN